MNFEEIEEKFGILGNDMSGLMSRIDNYEKASRRHEFDIDARQHRENSVLNMQGSILLRMEVIKRKHC